MSNNNQSKISWTDVVFYAEASREAFNDINIVTLKSHYQSLANQRALSLIPPTNNPDELYDRVRLVAGQIMDSGKIKVKQFVENTDNQITICLNVEEITDITTFNALDILSEIGVEDGKHEFGPYFAFQSFEIKGYQ